MSRTTPHPPSSTGAAGDPLAPVVESIVARIRRGESPSREEYEVRYPELAGTLRALWPALVAIEDLGDEASERTGSFRGRPARGDGPGLVGRWLGEYVLLRELGRGGMGVVFEAEQETLGRRVALKVLPPELTADARRLRRFEREARAAGRLHHTNIVPVFGVGHHGDTHYFIMQLIRGSGLDAVIGELRHLRAKVPDGVRGDGEPGRAVTSLARSLVSGVPVVRGPVPDPTAAPDADSPSALDLDIECPADRAGRATTPIEMDERPPSGPGAGSAVAGRRDASAVSSLSDPGRTYFESIARLGIQAADALDYAHRQGVLHRDVKPSNLLLDFQGTLWVADFGLAKMTEEEDLSASRDLVGTLRYLAPERFEGRADARSDVYSLGLTLYELLALRPAFDGVDQAALVRRVTRGEPASLCDLDPTIPRDLATVVHKAIAREPDRRYASAAEFAADLRRFLGKRPVHARRASAVERFRLWCRRNPALAAANIAAAMLTTTLAVVSTWAALQFRDQRDALGAQQVVTQRSLLRASAAEREALLREYDALTAQARASRFSGRQGQRFGTLKAVREANALLPRLNLDAQEVGQRRDELRDLAVAALALADLQQTTWPDYPGIREDRDHYAVSPDGTLRVRGDRDDGTLVVTRAADDSEVARLPGNREQRASMRFSPCNRYLTYGRRNEWFIWPIGDPRDTLVPCPVRAAEVVFSHDGAFLYILCPEAGQLVRVNCQDGTVGRVYAIPALPARGCNMALSPDGDRLALAMGAFLTPESEIVRILDLDTGELVHELDCGQSLQSLAWSASGALLAAGPANGSEVTLWDMTKGPPARLENLNQRREPNIAVAFNTSGTMLACVSNWGNGGLTVYEPNTRRQLLRVAGIFLVGFPTRTLGPNAGDRIFATAWGSVTSTTRNDIVPGSAFRSLTRTIPGYEVYQNVTIHKNNRIAAGGTIGGTVLWDLATGRQVGELPTGGNVWFEPEGGALWTSDSPMGKLRWPIQQVGRAFQIGPPTRYQRISNYDLPVRTSADGRLVALSPGHNIGAIVFPRDHPEQAFRIADGQDIRHLDVTSDGRFVITEALTRGNMSLWNATTGELLLDLEQDYEPSPFWREWSQSRDLPPGTKPWQSIPELRLGWYRVRLLDRRLLFEGYGPGRIRIEQIDTERVIAHLDAPLEENYRAVAVSPDGGHVLATGNDDPGGVRMWDLRLVRRELVAMGLDWDAPPIPDWPAGEDLSTPLTVEVITGPIRDPGHETRWLLGIAEKRLAGEPGDAEAHHERGLGLSALYRFDEARAAFDRSLALRADDPRTLLARARVLEALGLSGGARADESRALAALEGQADLRSRLATGLNNRAWYLVSSKDAPPADVRWGVIQARQAVLLESVSGAKQASLNTLGVALYRDGRHAESIDVLSRGLAGDQGFDAFDLFFRAMAHHRLGDPARARDDLDRAVRWVEAQTGLDPRYRDELAAFREEATAVLAGPPGGLPADVFARE